MGSPPEFQERRKDHALRAVYDRVQVLEKISKDQDKAIAVLEEKAVTKNLLMSGLFAVAVAVFGGAWVFKSGLQESAERPLRVQAAQIAKIAEKLDRNIEAQALVNVKTEAMYLINVERRSRAEVQEAVLRSTPPKEK